MSNQRLETKFIVVHSSQTTPEEDLSAKDIDRDASQRWTSKIGYHKIIKRDGTIEDGRDIDLVVFMLRAKGEVSNANSISICLNRRQEP